MREQLLARLHVQRSDHKLISGAQAFVTSWAALPGWPWLAFAASTSWVLKRTYEFFLRWRPLLQRWASC